MRSAAFESISPSAPITALPLILVQRPSHSRPWLLMMLALPAAAATLAPMSILAAHAVQDHAVLLERIETTLLMVACVLIWLAIFAWPIARHAVRIGSMRRVTIENHAISVVETGLFVRRTWRQPMSAYRGLAHHVRASLSGTRHELLLIHPDPARSVLLRADDTIGQSEIDGLARLLHCREIAPQVFYRNTEVKARGRFAASEPALAVAEV
jgi:hypothetical protein